MFCQREITVGVDKRFDPLDVKRLEEKPAMCQGCAQERGLDPSEKYFVFAGDIYQKVSNVHLRLWPVGSFH
ncbi:MAG: hypothetical protein HY314_10850 [Acidobacteria bacterium]|nr:hypothetical protein [Acidobacteriota bacterium]